MQIRTYTPDDVNMLMRRRIEGELLGKMLASFLSSAVFDCHEFGLCLVREGTSFDPHFLFEWYSERPRKTPKPRIVVTVTQTDGIEKHMRKRWHFAISHLGFLYCVAYELHQKQLKGNAWAPYEWYHSWEPHKARIPTGSNAVPEDWVFREAERLFKLKKRRKK